MKKMRMIYMEKSLKIKAPIFIIKKMIKQVKKRLKKKKLKK